MLNKAVLQWLYEQQDLTVDKLPYSPEIEVMRTKYCQLTKTDASFREIYNALMTLRKQGRLKLRGKVNKDNAPSID